MTLAVSAAEEAPAGLVPLLLPPDLKLTHEQFVRVCEANPAPAGCP